MHTEVGQDLHRPDHFTTQKILYGGLWWLGPGSEPVKVSESEECDVHMELEGVVLDWRFSWALSVIPRM